MITAKRFLIHSIHYLLKVTKRHAHLYSIPVSFPKWNTTHNGVHLSTSDLILQTHNSLVRQQVFLLHLLCTKQVSAARVMAVNETGSQEGRFIQTVNNTSDVYITLHSLNTRACVYSLFCFCFLVLRIKLWTLPMLGKHSYH
jgi:hypothetical protein